MEQKTIKIFLASSNELKEDRVWFGDFVQGIDKIYSKRGLHIDLTKWEYLDAAYKGQRQQNYYNEKVRESDLFVALFYTKGGNFTIEEFDVAMKEYRKKQSPKIYVYFRDLPKDEEWKPELKIFTKKLNKKGIFWNGYGSEDQLQLHFLQQLLIVENGLASLKLEGDKVTLEGMHVADIDNLPFAKGNKDYQRMSAELSTLPKDIENARQYLDKHPDNDFARDELQKKLNRYNELKEEFAGLQNTLFETSQRIAGMQREQLSDKLRRATEAFEKGNLDGANVLLDEIAHEAETHYKNLSQDRELVHQDIEAFLLQAKTVMAEVKTPIEERIKQVQAIYVKADEWAKESALPDEKYDGLLSDYASFLYDYGLYEKGETIYLRLINLRKEMYGKEHPKTAAAYNGIGALYNSAGKYSLALEYNNKAMAIQKIVLGLDHQDTAKSYSNIGNSFYWQDDYSQALKYYVDALSIRERILGPDHPDTALSYNEIAEVYHRQCDYDKALDYYGKALDIRERILGPDHPSTARSYNDIGLVYKSQCDYDNALKYYSKALEIWDWFLGSNHPNTAASYNNIGAVYRSLGDYDKALEFYNKALGIRERVLDPDHPSTAASYNNIGLVYMSRGDYDKALEYYRKALDIRERKLGPEHRYTKNTRRNIEKCRKKCRG